jgi:hypothetical protein
LNDTVYNLASRFATSGLGYLYEDAQGRIGYADSTHRAEYLVTDGYLNLDANDAIGPGLSIVLSEQVMLETAITIAYGSQGSQNVTDSDSSSIEQYGQLAATIDTTLAQSRMMLRIKQSSI